MSWLIEIYGFLAVLIRGVNLTLEAVTVGGVVFLTLCSADPACRRLLRWSASLLAAARWLELRLPGVPAALGRVWPVCFMAIGLALTFYRES